MVGERTWESGTWTSGGGWGENVLMATMQKDAMQGWASEGSGSLVNRARIPLRKSGLQRFAQFSDLQMEY